MINCPLGCHTPTEIYFASSLNVCVRSDCLPFEGNSMVHRCSGCGFLFKTPEFVSRWRDYVNYHAFADSSAMDKLDFSTDYPQQRSQVIIDFLADQGLLGAGKQVLDFGCHRGAFLALLAGKGHGGFDVSEGHRDQIEGLGCAYYTPQRPPPQASCDCLVLCHVAEHLVDVASGLAPGLRALREGGHVLIQVPAPSQQPTDLYVIDHYSHFSPSSLVRAMASAGLECIFAPHALIPGEWTAVFRKGRPAPLLSETHPGSLIVDRLKTGEQLLWAERKSERPLYLYGAGYLGAMFARFFEGQAAGFIDDSPMARTQTIENLRVFALEAVPARARVVITVPPSAARRVAARCSALGHVVVTPFLPAINLPDANTAPS